jgi:hypothetical protein
MKVLITWLRNRLPRAKYSFDFGNRLQTMRLIGAHLHMDVCHVALYLCSSIYPISIEFTETICLVSIHINRFACYCRAPRQEYRKPLIVHWVI